jgi:large subunit ribosomal protein L9
MNRTCQRNIEAGPFLEDTHESHFEGNHQFVGHHRKRSQCGGRICPQLPAPPGQSRSGHPQQRKILEQEKAKFELQIAKEKEFAQEMATRLEAVSVTIASKVHEADKLYGSVTVRDIIDALKKQEVEVEKRMVLLNEPIKTIGTFKVPIRVYQGVKPEITVEVVPEEA